MHSHPADRERTFSVHLGKNVFQCFQADCGVQGNVLDLWAAIHRLPLYEAALHLAETFGLPRNREEEPVNRNPSTGSRDDDACQWGRVGSTFAHANRSHHSGFMRIY